MSSKLAFELDRTLRDLYDKLLANKCVQQVYHVRKLRLSKWQHIQTISSGNLPFVRQCKQRPPKLKLDFAMCFVLVFSTAKGSVFVLG